MNPYIANIPSRGELTIEGQPLPDAYEFFASLLDGFSTEQLELLDRLLNAWQAHGDWCYINIDDVLLSIDVERNYRAPDGEEAQDLKYPQSSLVPATDTSGGYETLYRVVGELSRMQVLGTNTDSLFPAFVFPHDPGFFQRLEPCLRQA